MADVASHSQRVAMWRMPRAEDSEAASVAVTPTKRLFCELSSAQEESSPSKLIRREQTFPVMSTVDQIVFASPPLSSIGQARKESIMAPPIRVLVRETSVKSVNQPMSKTQAPTASPPPASEHITLTRGPAQSISISEGAI